MRLVYTCLIALIAITSGCKRYVCHPDKEPVVDLAFFIDSLSNDSIIVFSISDTIFETPNRRGYDTAVNVESLIIRGLKSGEVLPHIERDDTLYSYQVYHLPIDMNLDEVTYTIQSALRTDTITLYYTRSFYYQDSKCNYVIDIWVDSVKSPYRGTQYYQDELFREGRISYFNYVLEVLL
ncbi:MAG: hypothetical protein JKY53_02350 [Flavobacteriales bacterium]|nr:hypothetical protein [Flavobacteriales bacterium]